MSKVYGLIGKKLTHSFSASYFSAKFEREGINDCSYHLFELRDIKLLPDLISNKALEGLNVTIPYKTAVIPFLDALDESAEKVGAVNVIKKNRDGAMTGYNSDYFGFKKSLESLLGNQLQIQALILGNGGAAKAVAAVLNDLNIPHQIVSRSESELLSYSELDEKIISSHRLIVNTTPLGMYPHEETRPDLPYHLLTPDHFLFDLIYNPESTAFMKAGSANGATVQNGLEMLHLQAEKSWEIWNS